MFEIQMPTECPACSAPVVFEDPQLFCTNKDCSAQWQKKLEHFASTLKIKGLGPATLHKLELQEYTDLYALSVEEISETLGSEKLAQKLVQEIEKSKQADLETVLPAFSIPLIGQSASKKLCSVVSSIEDITAETCEEAGIGPKATANLLDWLDEEFFAYDLDNLLPFDFKTKNVATVSGPCAGIVCISGKLSSFKSKAEAQRYLENYGYVVKTSLTKDCTHLVNESGIESAKTRTARERGVQIVENLLTFIGE
jgi:DNA ligase (NAD+)